MVAEPIFQSAVLEVFLVCFLELVDGLGGPYHVLLCFVLQHHSHSISHLWRVPWTCVAHDVEPGCSRGRFDSLVGGMCRAIDNSDHICSDFYLCSSWACM